MMWQLTLPWLLARAAVRTDSPDPCAPAGLSMGIAAGGHAQIKGPSSIDRATVSAWHDAMQTMRTACQASIGFNGSAFELDALKWTQTSYMQPQSHTYDRFLFDPALGNGTDGSGYTVDRFLDDLTARYGGIDSVLLWPTYTNLGIDDTSQFQMTRNLPGGLDGIRKMVDQFHTRGVHVLWAYNPWDRSTAGQQNASATDMVALAKLIRDTNADGFNGDTMGNIPFGYQQAAEMLYKPIAMEAEGGLHQLAMLNYDTLGWAEANIADEPGARDNIPDVSRAKWVSGGKAMEHWSDRYAGSPAGMDQFDPARTRISAIQNCWFNGLGYETWENIWGVWNQICARDGEALRRVGTLLRYFGARGFIQSSDWTPHTLDVQTMGQGIFGSSFPSPDGEEVVYTLVNRRSEPLWAHHVKPALTSAPSDTKSPLKFYDCWHGRELSLDPATKSLEFFIDSNGFGCILVSRNTTHLDEQRLQLENNRSVVRPSNLTALLATMTRMSAKNLSSIPCDWAYAPQEVLSPSPTPRRPANESRPGEVYVPAANPFHFEASGVEIEGAAGSGVDVQFPWEPHPQRLHSHDVQVGAMYVDKHPVTNAQFAAFLEASNYRPIDAGRFLLRNFEAGKPRSGWENRPVTYVAIEDAKAYCRFYNKRLPSAVEWQYFAQGLDGRLYPWGNTDDASRTPAVNNNFTDPGPVEVGQHPSGASLFGVEDLVRHVWQYTSEFQDNHSRTAVLRGGSSYGPWRGAGTIAPGSVDPVTGLPLLHPSGGSRWYFRQAYRLDLFNTYHLMSGSYDRAGTISFRCVADADDDGGADGRLLLSHGPARSPAVAADDLSFVEIHTDASGLERRLLSSPIAYSIELEPSTWARVATNETMLFDIGGTRVRANGTRLMSANSQVRITAPAPKHGRSNLLRLWTGASLGAKMMLSASVNGSRSNGVESVRIRQGQSEINLTYRGGELTALLKPLVGTVCPGDGPCITENSAICPPGKPMFACVQTISVPGALDWAHWGSLNCTESCFNSSGNWDAVRMQGSPHLLNPRLEMPNGSKTDLSTWAGQFWPSDRAIWSWAGGDPVSRTDSAYAGVYSVKGTIQLTIPADPLNRPRKLTLFVGLFHWGPFGASATLTVASQGHPSVTNRIEHINGNNNDWANRRIVVQFRGEINVSWAVDPCDVVNAQGHKCGAVALQAAILELGSSEFPSVTVFAASIKNKSDF